MRRNRATRMAFQSGAGAARGIRRTVKSARSSSRRISSRGGRSSDPPPLTGEHDYRNVYRKKRMPWRKKKKWVSFKRKVNSVLDRRLGTNALLITRSSIIGAPAGAQAGIPGHIVLDRQDLSELKDRVASVSPLTPLLIPASNMRYTVTGTFVESIHRNTTENTIFVDLYYWRVKRDVPLSEFANFNDVITAVTGSTANFNQTTGSGGSTLTAGDLGWTPFLSTAAHRFLEIYNKRRVKVSPGGVFQVTQRSSRNVYVKADEFLDAKSLVRGMTHGVYMMMYGAPSGVVGVPGQAAASQLSSVVHKTYYYKVLQNNYETRGELRPA